MGRKKIQMNYIHDTRVRRVTFKKRKIGLLKKAMELSMLTNSNVCLKVYNPENRSLTEYYTTTKEDNLEIFKKESSLVMRHAKYYNDDYDQVERIENN